MANKIVLLGGGGHCRSCIDVLESVEGFRIAGILDQHPEGKASLLGYPVLGNDGQLGQLIEEGHMLLVTIGQIKDAAPRVRAYERILALNGRLARPVASTARVSRHASIGQGTI